MRKELLALQEDKHNYETTAKESLRRVLQEKIEVFRKLSERSLSNTEDECRQEELTQRGETEKRDLEMKIEEMEEKEQVLQARIEALQADNDFTNERLAALQGTSERRSCLDASWSIPSKHERVSVVCDRWDTELSPFGSASLPSAPQRGRPEVRLNALSLLLLFTARLEQLQEKSSKENNSLGESLSHWLALGRPPCLCGVH
uniref:Uncharacterized protein n=1 Tax=Oryzias melastigma TaxID=30732 RepID=A0A3B3C4K8_ORYME